MNNIDKLFKKGAAGFEIEPSEGLFESIEAAHLGSKQRKRKGFLIWMSAAVFFLLSIISGWYWVDYSNSKPSQGTQTISRNQIENEKIERNKSEEFSDAPEVIPLTDLTEENTESRNVEEYLPYVEDVNTEKQVLMNESEIVLNGSLPSNTRSQERDSETEISTILPLFENSISQPLPDSINPQLKAALEKYKEKNQKLHFFTGLGGTIGMSYYPSTEDQPTYAGGVVLGLKFSRFYVETGISYQKTQERGIYQIDFKSNDSIGYFNEVISFEIDPQNPDEINYNTQKTTVYDSVNHYVHQTPLFKYSYLNLPLKFGYIFYQKKKISLAAETGVVFSKMLDSEIPEATLDNPEYELISITNQTPLRVDFNYQWLLSVRMNYHFNKTVSLAVQPVFGKYLNSIYDTKNGATDTRPYSMGLRVGVYFDF